MNELFGLFCMGETELTVFLTCFKLFAWLVSFNSDKDFMLALLFQLIHFSTKLLRFSNLYLFICINKMKRTLIQEVQANDLL